MKYLLLTCRNIFNSTGEYSLIYRRAAAIFKVYGKKSDIIAFQTQDRVASYDKILFNDNCFDKKVFLGYKLNNLIKRFFNVKKELIKYLYEEKPTTIVVSGYFIGLFYNVLKKYLRKNECRIIYDMHGCVEELLEYTHPRVKFKFLSKLYYLFSKRQERKLLSISSGIFIVSNDMREYVKVKYPELAINLKFYYIPCGIDKKFTDINERLLARKRWRKVLGLNDDEVVFVYSGGLSRWQKIDRIINLYSEISNTILNSKMCIFTAETEKISKIIDPKYRNNYILRSLNSAEVIDALTACDFGMILRDDNITNNVAFPNKVSEYIEAGLNIIISESLKTPIEIVKKYDLGIGIKENIDLFELEKRIITRKKNLVKIYEKCDKVVEDELKYENLIYKSSIFN